MTPIDGVPLLMNIFEKRREEYHITTDQGKINWSVVHAFLSEKTDWRKGISLAEFKADLADSLCFGLYLNEEQIGFASVTTDFTAFAYLTDVFVLEKYRGQGLAQWLLETVMAHPDLQDGIEWMLSTEDAQGLYEKLGFSKVEGDEEQMKWEGSK